MTQCSGPSQLFGYCPQWLPRLLLLLILVRLVKLRCLGNNNATDSHIPGHALAHGSVDGDGIGSDCNMTKGGANAKVSDRHVPINKQNRVPFVTLFKNNRMANVNHKLQFMDNGKDKLKFGYEHMDSVE